MMDGPSIISPTADGAAPQGAWWGAFDVSPQHQIRWRLGGLTVWAQRMVHEWRIAWSNGPGDADNVADVMLNSRPEPLDGAQQLRRYGFNSPSERIRASPTLPDRAVVTKPDTPLYVFGGEQVTLYLHFPLWLRLEVGEASRLLQELSSLRLSDTWFGPNTREGELCYASRTPARLHLEELGHSAHQAVTPVIIRNRATDSLFVERLNVNLPMLSLYRDVHGALWTNALTLERVEGQSLASLDIQRRPPSEAQGATFVSSPRLSDQRNLLVRAFSSFLS